MQEAGGRHGERRRAGRITVFLKMSLGESWGGRLPTTRKNFVIFAGVAANFALLIVPALSCDTSLSRCHLSPTAAALSWCKVGLAINWLRDVKPDEHARLPRKCSSNMSSAHICATMEVVALQGTQLSSCLRVSPSGNAIRHECVCFSETSSLVA